jgi:N-acetylglutamate synthase-like GNAT family acetyltransferase
MEPTIAIRVSSRADAAGVTAVLESSYPELMKPAYRDTILRRALPAIVRANPTLLASGTYYVATADDGLVVGCGGWTHEKPGTVETEPGVGHLRHFAIRPGWNGQGIGRQIYDRCETDARAEGVTILEVYASLNAPAFYGSLGFSKVDEIVVAVGQDIPFPSIWMRRSIAGV